MSPVEHLDKALLLLAERNMKYNEIWDSVIACRDHLQNTSANNHLTNGATYTESVQ